MTAVDGRDPEELLRALARLGLVESGQDQSTLVVHPVVADTNRAHLLAPTTPPDPDPRVVRETAIALMVDILGELDPKSPSDWQRYRQLAPHVLAMLQTTGSHVSEDRLDTLLDAVSWVAEAYRWAGSPASAMTVSHAALALSARLGQDHPAILRLRYNLAVAIAGLGRWHETESAFSEVLEAQQRVLGADHPDTLVTRQELAWAPAEQLRWKEAESAMREVLEAQQRVLGADHPQTLHTRVAIALGPSGE